MESVVHLPRPQYEEQLSRLHETILEMGDLVDTAITLAVSALETRDVALCERVITGDARLNELQRDVRERSFRLILNQEPRDRDLREIMGMQHMAAELERIGDHGVSIAKIARTICDLPERSRPLDLGTMTGYCRDQLRGVLAAVVSRDVERARAVARADDRVDRVYHRLFDELVHGLKEAENSGEALRDTNLVFIAHHLERIGDRVTNIAEDLVFEETGRIEELG